MSMQAFLDETELFSYYESVFHGLPAKTQLFLESGRSVFAAMVAQLESNPNFLIERFQSLVREESVELTLWELMQSAPLQQQSGINPAKVASIWDNSEIGIKKLPALLNPPEVTVLSDGKLLMVGGNHRVAFLVTMLIAGGVDEDTLANTRVRCKMYVIDDSQLSSVFKDSDATEAELHDQVAFALWVASNSSRSMTAAEISTASAVKARVDTTSEDSVLQALEDGNLTEKTALRFLTIQALDSQDLEAIEASPETVPFVFNAEGWNDNNPYTLKALTLESLTASVLASIKKHRASFDVEQKDGTVTSKEVSVYARSYKLQRSQFLMSVAEYISESLQFSINRVMASAVGSELAGNIARMKTRIADDIASGYVANIEPLEEPIAPPKAPAKAKATKSSFYKGSAFRL